MINIVTGGSGFIGTNLLIERGGGLVVDHHEPRAPNCTRVYYQDLMTSPSEWISKDDQVRVYFLQSRKIPMYGGRLENTANNLSGLLSAVELAKSIHHNGNEISVFYASTSDVYGNVGLPPNREIDNVSLGDPSSARWSYGACKIVGEHLFLGLMEKYDIPVTVGRIFSSYGPYGNMKEFWKAGIQQVLLCNAILGKKTTIYGDGRQTRTYIYIDDLIKAINHLMDNNAVGVFNLCSNGPVVSMRQLAELVQNIHGDTLDIEYKSYESIRETKYQDVINKHGSNVKLKDAVPGWEPLVELERGLHMTYLWLEKELNG
jgi:nucleoside-diphosphate-sugar epimerase